MANEVINIGCKIEIRAENRRLMTEETNEPEVYISQFLQWLDTNVAVIVVPTFKGYLVPLRVDEVYDLQFVTKSGLYRCRGKIMKRMKTANNIATAVVKFVSALEKFQRRQYFRMNCCNRLYRK